MPMSGYGFEKKCSVPLKKLKQKKKRKCSFACASSGYFWTSNKKIGIYIAVLIDKKKNPLACHIIRPFSFYPNPPQSKNIFQFFFFIASHDFYQLCTPPQFQLSISTWVALGETNLSWRWSHDLLYSVAVFPSAQPSWKYSFLVFIKNQKEKNWEINEGILFLTCCLFYLLDLFHSESFHNEIKW